MELADFVQAIIEEPSNDDHRLILADYLEERDDPRSELIRLQFEMKATSKLDPKWSRLRSRELKLLREHGGFGTAPKIGRILSWHGGFVDEIETTVAQLVDNSEELIGKTTVQAVQLKATSKRFKKVFESPHLSRLKKLTFKNNHIANDEMCEFLRLETLGNLRELSINIGELGDSPAVTISKMEHFSGLETLSLNGYSVGTGSARAIAGCSHLGKLRELAIGHSVADEGLRAIADSAHLKHLVRLELFGGFSAEGIAELRNGPFAQSLSKLVISSSLSFGPRGVADPFPNLKSLELDSGLSNDVLVQIADQYRNLEELNLAGNLLNDLGIKALAESELLSSLRKLVLTGNEVTTQGVNLLCSSKFWNGKTKVYLRSNHLSTADRKAIKKKYGKTFGNLGPDWDSWYT